MAPLMAMVGLLLAYSPAVFASSNPNCANLTISNVFGIGDCLGNNGDFCTYPSMPFTKFVIKLVGCALKGIAKEGTPEEAVKALKGIGLILLNTLGLGDVLKKVSGAGMWCGSCKRVCKDPLHLNQGDTGLLAKCIDDAGVFCQKGALAEDTIYEELFETLKCLLNALSKQDLLTVTIGLICDISTLFKVANAGVDILTLLDRITFTVLAGLTC
ncbi:uncharacterized protein LOC144132436 isoform X2 [Amblyomma americanum]